MEARGGTFGMHPKEVLWDPSVLEHHLDSTTAALCLGFRPDLMTW